MDLRNDAFVSLTSDIISYKLIFASILKNCILASINVVHISSQITNYACL